MCPRVGIVMCVLDSTKNYILYFRCVQLHFNVKVVFTSVLHAKRPMAIYVLYCFKEKVMC